MCGASLALYVIASPPALNIIVMGIDARPGEGLLTRSDSNIVIGVQPSTLRASMLSIPRDLFITMPNRGLQRINTINALAEQQRQGSGGQALADSIANSFGFPVQRYLRVDFNGFVNLIDAIGGVTIDVPSAIVDYNYPTINYGVQIVRFEAGRQHMNGERALIYARLRPDSDYHRAERQQIILRAVLNKLMNPIYWLPAWATLQQAVDTNLSPFDALTMLPPILLNMGSIDQLVIDRNYIVPRDGFAVPNYDLLRPWISERFNHAGSP